MATKTKAPGEYMPHAERAKRTQRKRVDVYVSKEAGEHLDAIVAEIRDGDRTKAEAVERAILAYPLQKQRAGDGAKKKTGA